MIAHFNTIIGTEKNQGKNGKNVNRNYEEVKD